MEYKLICKECEKEGRKQPPHFLEATKWDINEVTAEGKYIRQREGRLNYYLDYQCPQCNAKAQWEVPQRCAKSVRLPSKKVL